MASSLSTARTAFPEAASLSQPPASEAAKETGSEADSALDMKASTPYFATKSSGSMPCSSLITPGQQPSASRISHAFTAALFPAASPS